MSNDSLVVLITGCSSGFGRSLALDAISRGLRVIATARRLSTLDELRDKGAKVFTLDVTVKRQVFEEFVREAIAAFGQVDILINNAGQALTGAIEENTLSILLTYRSLSFSSEEQIYDQFNTNFFGVINLTCAFLPHFRQRRTGTIVNISSQGADLALPGAGIYCASKAALDSVTEVWSKELAPFNIRALSLGLGAFRTDIATKNVIKSQGKEIEGYDLAHEFLKFVQEQSGKRIPPRLFIGEDALKINVPVLKKRLDEIEEWKDFPVGVDVDVPVFEGSGGDF
ncbi:putative short-chain oxidoreductase [Dendrothele bispora CBS 962.96]|uniref:Putative short-chain oxidoreductase n=1 Tax=Dendrothele bispora (strain CBS 962.96) TaxID=1314807 RepID=A0A4S8MHQ9_DENBC|nr:putative short-chain oxidoreductase [Dendrothele bispora CBS 962.96]